MDVVKAECMYRPIIPIDVKPEATKVLMISRICFEVGTTVLKDNEEDAWLVLGIMDFSLKASLMADIPSL